ncbi:MAG: TIGR03862 family flavoprotein [Pseudomonadota bacterium]
MDVAVIGAGPAGLAAAEVASETEARVVVFEAKPSPARKFLMAGKSGLNLTKDEDVDAVLLAVQCPRLEPMLRAFGPEAVRDWAEELGEPLFTGSSGRVFPKAMKGSPLLRKWLERLSARGVTLRTRWRWSGWSDDLLSFETTEGIHRVQPRTTVLALGGASWTRLGSDAAWVPWLAERGVGLEPFRPANMGFDVDWSEHFRTRFAGTPVKPVALAVGARNVRGEFVISATGIEGSAVYAVSSSLRDALVLGDTAGASGSKLASEDAALILDLIPGKTASELAAKLSKPRGKASLSNHLRKTIGLSGVRAGLLRELAHPLPDEPEAFANQIKALSVPVLRPRPIDEAISVAGGIAWCSLDDDLMLQEVPGVFAAGEMLDWEAPTGGYLLTACIATGRWAGFAAGRLAASKD